MMVIDGIHAVREALRARPELVERIWITRGKTNPRLQSVIDLARSQHLPLRFEPLGVIEKKAASSQHQDVVAELSPIPYSNVKEILQTDPDLILLLEGVEDPHNLGAVLRTAEAIGAQGVLLPKRRSCSLTPVVIKSSAGAALHVPIARIGNTVQTIEELKKKGLWILGLHAQGRDSLHEIDLTVPLVVVVGGEHTGVRRLVREHCDFLVALPMKGRVSSLNLSVAAGVVLYEILLRRERE